MVDSLVGALPAADAQKTGCTRQLVSTKKAAMIATVTRDNSSTHDQDLHSQLERGERSIETKMATSEGAGPGLRNEHSWCGPCRLHLLYVFPMICRPGLSHLGPFPIAASKAIVLIG